MNLNCLKLRWLILLKPKWACELPATFRPAEEVYELFDLTVIRSLSKPVTFTRVCLTHGLSIGEAALLTNLENPSSGNGSTLIPDLYNCFWQATTNWVQKILVGAVFEIHEECCLTSPCSFCFCELVEWLCYLKRLFFLSQVRSCSSLSLSLSRKQLPKKQVAGRRAGFALAWLQLVSCWFGFFHLKIMLSYH